jgi:hypothetical protein
LEDNIEKKMGWLVGRQKIKDEERGLPRDEAKRKEQTSKFSAFGKKRV